jgi:ABC-type dipeptide/oligopeptide/nickel transport system permease subunit
MALLGLGISAGLGVPLGLLAGYQGGWADQIASRLVDVLLALPGLLLAVIIVARLGPSLRNAALALGTVGIPSFYRLARSSTMSVRQASYVEAAQSLGATGVRIVLRHILPNIAPSLIVLATMRIGVLILAGGGLSFIGLGAQPPQPEWGALLADGRAYLGSAPWLGWFPGVVITATVVGFNLLGDGLCTLFDPQAGRR